MKRIAFILSLVLTLPSLAASLPKAQRLSIWGIPAANYSGLTPFGEGRYAVVSDKEPLDGFYVWQIVQDRQTGQVSYVVNRGYKGQVPLDTNTDGISLRDAEDIVWCPQRHSFFVCGEGYQDIVEMDMEGQRTGYELPIPDYLRNIYPNYGFESLAYDSVSQTFYTITENVLPADGAPTSSLNRVAATLHLQTFRPSAKPGTDGKPQFEAGDRFEYQMDMPRATRLGRSLTHGVVAVTALGGGKLAVLEREAYVAQAFTGSWVWNKLYVVDTNAPAGTMLCKQFVTQWDTHLRLTEYNWANYEGMCLGQPLPDGRQTLILVSDSQGGYGLGPAHLQDYIRVVIL